MVTICVLARPQAKARDKGVYIIGGGMRAYGGGATDGRVMVTNTSGVDTSIWWERMRAYLNSIGMTRKRGCTTLGYHLLARWNVSLRYRDRCLIWKDE